MKKYPLIISAPHSCSVVPNIFRDRISLSDYEIWQFSDPFTGETSKHPKAFSVNCWKTHRALWDLCRDYDLDEAFREKDFYWRNIWKKWKFLKNDEKNILLNNHWKLFRKELLEKIGELGELWFKKILFIDHHNTACDHPVKDWEYISTVSISNIWEKNTWKKIDWENSCPSEFMIFLKWKIEENLPLVCEINKPYKASKIIRWINWEVKEKFWNIEIYSILIEYNLNLIHNPLTKKNDLKALEILKKWLNMSISSLIEKFILD